VFTIEHRVRPGLNKEPGVVTMEAIPIYARVWTPDPLRDLVIRFDEFKKVTGPEFELIMALGFVHLPYSNDVVVPAGAFQQMRLASLTHDRNPNLVILYDTLVAARQIKKGEELVCPIDFDQALSWKRRVMMSGGYKRANNQRPCRPTVKGYVRYARKQQLGVG
jgi:hypothetical protein